MKFIYSFILFIASISAQADIMLTCTAVDPQTHAIKNASDIETIKIDTYVFIGKLKQIIECYKADCSGKDPGIVYSTKKMKQKENSYFFEDKSFWGLGFGNSSVEIEKQLLDQSLAGISSQGLVETNYSSDNILYTGGTHIHKILLCKNNIK